MTKDEKSVYDYIWIDIMNRQGDFVVIKKQLNRYLKENNWKWTGMLATMKYWKDICENSWDDEYGAGQIFEFGYYDRARQYYQNIQSIRKQIEKKSDDFWKTEYKVITGAKRQKLTDFYIENIEDL